MFVPVNSLCRIFSSVSFCHSYTCQVSAINICRHVELCSTSKIPFTSLNNFIFLWNCNCLKFVLFSQSVLYWIRHPPEPIIKWLQFSVTLKVMRYAVQIASICNWQSRLLTVKSNTRIVYVINQTGAYSLRIIRWKLYFHVIVH